jgi:Mrp family chromosome partitioning ATPase
MGYASRRPPEDHEFTIEEILRDRYLQQIHPPVDVVAPKTQPVAAKAETIVVQAVSQKEGPPVEQARPAGTAVEGQPSLEMQAAAPASCGVGVGGADEPGTVAENFPAAEPQGIEAPAGAAEKPEPEAKAETESGAADAAKSAFAPESIRGDAARVESVAREEAGSRTSLSEAVPPRTQEDADHGITHGNGAGELSHRGSGSRFVPASATRRSTFKNGKKETMESLFHTAPKPQVVSEAGSTISLSEAVPPRTKQEADHGITHGNGAKGLRFWDTGDGVVHTSARKLDNSRIKNEVVLAQRLSREQERSLHFIIQRYRLLCNRLIEVAHNLHSQVFLMTSALAEEGKTLTTANLAFALSGIERKRTLLIDLDLRRYTLHSVLGIPSSTSEPLFLETEDWHACLWSLRPNLDALLPTRQADQPDQLLHSAAMQNLLVAARQEYDYVLIDSAPLLLAADTHALLPIIDQALLVVRADHTPIACSQDALKILGDKAVGCILNDVKRLKYESYYRGYYGADDTP